MKHRSAFLPCLIGLCATLPGLAMDLKQSKVTQVINEVQIISANDQQQKAAAVNDIFTMPDILRTGPASRAELVAPDQTVTRVGADTIFSFDPASRTIDLKQGSLLFHSPHGKGGGSIQTGSATASVLGSTLIVSATPNGGFKVISLEDGVDIKLPSGRHQHLTPGELTFILPGGQLAPIVLFRMSDLIRHSQLVGGFAHPLPSLPLIVNEINQQNKQIKSGRLVDTGLLAGNNANADQVEVLDPNTVQSVVNSQGVQNALATDATINQSSLTYAKIPVPPTRIFLNPAFILPGNPFYAGQTFQGFAAHNLTFNNAGGTPTSLNVNLSSYAAQPEFDFVAAKNLDLAGLVTFSGLSAQSQLALVAGAQMLFTPGITLTANVGDFELASADTMTLNNVTLQNPGGVVGLSSGSTINLNNGSILAAHLILTAPDAINFTFDASLNIGPPGDNTLITDAGSGAVTFSSLNGSLTVTATSVQAHYLTLNSGDSILLDCSGHTLTATGPGATATFTAPNLVTVNNANLSNYGVVNMAANTINLLNVAFGAGSSVTLRSLNGVLAANPNTGAVSVPGDVNFIQNVTYNGNPAQNYVNNSGGITITTLH